MIFKLKSKKVKLSDLRISSHSLTGNCSLFYPISGGNYFSLKYKNKSCNIINMSLENFQQIKSTNKLNKIKLIEIFKKDGTSTNGFLLYSKKLEKDWYLTYLSTYGTEIKNFDDYYEKDLFTHELKFENFAINNGMSKKINHKIFEKMIVEKTRSDFANHTFHYLDVRNNNDIMDKLNNEILDSKYNNWRSHDKGKVFDKGIVFLDILSEQYQISYTDFGNLYSYSKNKLDYIDKSILGYSIFNELNKSVEHFIIVNDKYKNFLQRTLDYEQFTENCKNLTDSGVYKFHTLLKKEREEEKQNKLMGRKQNNEYSNIEFKEMLNTLDGINYQDYSIKDELNLDLNRLVKELKERKILKSDNNDYAISKTTKTRIVSVYYYELTIEEEINEKQFIARVSSNDSTFYYFLFEKGNDENWTYKNVVKKKKIIETYE